MNLRNWILGIAAIGFQLSASASNLATPGAIQSLLQLTGTQFEYLAVSDVSVLTRGQQTRYSLSVLPSTDPVFALQTILTALDAGQHIHAIETDRIAGLPAAGVHVKQQTSDWWMVIKKSELNLLVRLQDVQDARAHRRELEQLVASVRLAPASLPALVTGNYTTASSYSDSYGSDLSSFSESSVSLNPDGSFGSSSYAGVSGDGVSGYSQGDGPGGWWQVRGNRILAFEPPDNFYNYRFEAFSNGLEVYDESNQRLLWVRK